MIGVGGDFVSFLKIIFQKMMSIDCAKKVFNKLRNICKCLYGLKKKY